MHLHVGHPHTRGVVTQALPGIRLTLVSCQVLNVMRMIVYMCEHRAMTYDKGVHLYSEQALIRFRR